MTDDLILKALYPKTYPYKCWCGFDGDLEQANDKHIYVNYRCPKCNTNYSFSYLKSVK